MSHHVFYYIVGLFILFPTMLSAQEQTDTITAARKVDFKTIPSIEGIRPINVLEATKIISPLGEGDPIRFIQTLSGVAAGSEGSSAIYVRGSGAGNSTITIDGVPIYGMTHMLGLTTVVPQDVISDVQFIKGGFGHGMGGYTGAQVNLYSKDGDYTKSQKEVSLNTFLPGFIYSMPLKKEKTSLLLSSRWSPITHEFNLANGLFKKNGLGVDSLKTGIFDVFAKLSHRISESYSLYVSGFYSQDSYNYTTKNHSNQRLKWSNTIGQIRLAHKNDDTGWELSAHYNSFKSTQEKKGYSSDTYNFLSAQSSVNDLSLSFSYQWHGFDNLSINGGASLSYTIFKPGTNKVISDNVSSSGVTEKKATKGTLYIKAIQDFINGKIKMSESIRGTLYSLDKTRLIPEFSLSGRYYFLPDLFADFSINWTSQLTHTLEGMPLGWSTDLIVPSDRDIAPESAFQVSPGLYYTTPKSTVYIGTYYKSMNKLLYYTDAASIFGARRGAWKDFITVGNGSSYGLEIEYSFVSERFSAKAAYTLSKTDRQFEGINEGRTFPAKNDRRHILNVSGEYVSSKKKYSKFMITCAFTFQSGHWDTANADQYGVPLQESIVQKNPIDFLIDYCSGINNYRHPSYIRTDLGVRYEIYGKDVLHTLSVGIFNIMNRHNPFSIYFDTDSGKWKRLSLIPILPTFSYKLVF